MREFGIPRKLINLVKITTVNRQNNSAHANVVVILGWLARVTEF
jgi:hypothetical protein